jgi:hypothetical protein
MGRITNTRVHAEPSERNPYVCCITREKDTAVAISIGDQSARGPSFDSKNFDRHLGSQRSRNSHFQINFVEVLSRRNREMKKPKLLSIQRDESPELICVDDPIHPCGSVAVILDQFRRSKIYRHVTREDVDAIQLNAELAPNRAASTVASNQVTRTVGFAPAGCDFHRFDRHFAVAVRETLDPPAAADFGPGERACMVVQDGLDEYLADAMLRLRRGPSFIKCACVLPAHGGGRQIEPPQKVAIHAGDVEDMRWMIGRQAGGAQPIRTTKPSKVFHRARVCGVAFGIWRLGGNPLLEQKTRHAAPTQIHREGKPDGPTSRDDYWNFCHGKLSFLYL